MSENTNTALEISSETRAIQHAANEVLSMKFNVFQKGVHYGEPFKGSGKATLLKPGAEMLMSRFGLWPNFIERGCVEDFDKPLFHYRYECRLMRVDTGAIAGAGIGSCNSMEDKYRWRKSDRVCPNCQEPKIIKSKYPDRKTGDVGWYCLACKSSFASTDPAITNQEVGRVQNDDVYSLVNTLDKMAQKRALIAAVLVATGASAWFTQDVEDFAGYEGVIVDAEDVTPAEHTTPRIIDGDTGEVTRQPAGNGRADVSTHNPPKASMADELPPAAQEMANAYDPATDNRPLSQATWGELSRYVVAQKVGDITSIMHAGNAVLKAMKKAGKMTEEQGWPELYALPPTIREIYEALVAYYEGAPDDAAAEPAEQKPLLKAPVPADTTAKRKRAS